MNVNKLYIYIANLSATYLGKTELEAGGHRGVTHGLFWESWVAGPGWGTGRAWALVQHSWFLETSSDLAQMGQAAGNSSNQGCTFARPIF